MLPNNPRKFAAEREANSHEIHEYKTKVSSFPEAVLREITRPRGRREYEIRGGGGRYTRGLRRAWERDGGGGRTRAVSSTRATDKCGSRACARARFNVVFAVSRQWASSRPYVVVVVNDAVSSPRLHRPRREENFDSREW